MTQNISSAVMAQRREPHDSLDDFPTPPWAGRALCDWLAGRDRTLGQQLVREPAANRGHLVTALSDYFGTVEAADIHDYGMGYSVGDYLFGPPPAPVDWTITNPPFRLAPEFIAQALRSSDQGVAMLVRTSFLEGAVRHATLFRNCPPTDILQFCERVIMLKGRLVDPDKPIPIWSKKENAWVLRRPSSATAYCWLIWDLRDPAGQPRFDWLPPCRRRLTRPGDYPEVEAG